MNTKAAGYAALVEQRKRCELCSQITNPSKVGKLDSDEIGPWSLWQGNLDSPIMLVGQDWGDVSAFEKQKGKDIDSSPTNRALIELFSKLGHTLSPPSKVTPKNQQLFFTNAVLCLKQGGCQGKVLPEWFSNCGARFLKPTIDLIIPEVVICLGQKAYKAVLAAYKPPSSPSFHSAVKRDEPVYLSNGVAVFAVYHCSHRIQHTHRPMPKQLEDWERIGRWLARKRQDG